MTCFSHILFVFVQWSLLGRINLSVSDVIVSQKMFQWRWKATFLWAGVYFYFLSLRKGTSLGRDTQKNMEKGDLVQHLELAAPKHWSKYTSDDYLKLVLIASFVLFLTKIYFYLNPFSHFLCYNIF